MRTSLANGLAKSHWAGPVLGPLTNGLGHLIGVSPDECAAYMWYGMYAAQKGMYRRNRHGEDIGDKNLWSPPGVKEKVWDHTLEETSK